MHLTSRPDTPVACDMTTARDTPGERIAEYDELFERALLGRERRADSVVLAFRADAREQVEDLARREYACCPFLDHAVETAGDRVVWTISGDDRPAVVATLDAFHDLPDHAGTGLDGLLDRVGVDRAIAFRE
jgi:hypothetical protein